MFWVCGEAGDEGSGGVFVEVVEWDGFLENAAEVFFSVERGDFLLHFSIMRGSEEIGTDH